MNAWHMLDEVRGNIGEATASHWTNPRILRKLNMWHRQAAAKVIMSGGDWLLKQSSALTPSSNAISLPSDCAKPVYLENVSSGEEIPLNITVRERRITRVPGTSLSAGIVSAYVQGTSLVVNMDSFTDTVYLWYQQKVPDLHTGTGETGTGTNTILFEAANYPARTDDYYNGSYLEVMVGTGLGTRAAISDYTGSTGTATVAGTFGTTSQYGTESLLPEEAIGWIVLAATLDCLAKPGASIDAQYYQRYGNLEKVARDTFTDWLSGQVDNTRFVRIVEYD